MGQNEASFTARFFTTTDALNNQLAAVLKSPINGE